MNKTSNPLRFKHYVSRFLSRVRRNHALEHATMTVLSERQRGLRLVGRSSLWGFYIYGDVPTESLLAAAQEGLRRLKAGQRQMAIHPNCGTNLAVAGILAGLGAFLSLGGLSMRNQVSRKKPGFLLERLARLPLACTAAMLGIVAARPLGTALQARVTTQANVGNLRIVGVTREEKGSVVIHHVRTEG
ncbi:MAG: hypothetical protein B6I35_15575 [Anaerolineaceae bacterium 4572_32.2]|nr:MAG: hypothetical protein B6I35_15575 [Anaerolineaceae bacterium 4572_32.2]